MFSDYKDALGIPGKGAHIHFMGIAIGDVIMTIIVAYLFHRISGFIFWKCLFGLFLVGILLHRLFDVRTTLDKIIFNRV